MIFTVSAPTAASSFSSSFPHSCFWSCHHHCLHHHTALLFPSSSSFFLLVSHCCCNQHIIPLHSLGFAQRAGEQVSDWSTSTLPLLFWGDRPDGSLIQSGLSALRHSSLSSGQPMGSLPAPQSCQAVSSIHICLRGTCVLLEPGSVLGMA